MKSKLSVVLAAAMTMPPIAMICLAASVAVISGARAETTLERGSYLVNAIMVTGVIRRVRGAVSSI